ncbi:MAG: glycosyltransferase family 39 protein [Isosphaeraceae bacterium]
MPPTPAGESGPPARAQPQDSEAVRAAQPLSLAACLAIAAALRFWEIGRASLWYDEVVTMRLARQPGPSALLRLLFEIDATRAPLHPILLQAWLKLTGPSDGAGRAFSAVCGVFTVAVAYAIGRDRFGGKAGPWAAWLVAVSPALVRYSREVRMYSWLVLVTALAWWLMLGAAPGRGRWRPAGWAFGMAAIAYSHPLGLFMNAALMAGSLLVWKRSWGCWVAVQAAWIAAIRRGPVLLRPCPRNRSSIGPRFGCSWACPSSLSAATRGPWPWYYPWSARAGIRPGAIRPGGPCSPGS